MATTPDNPTADRQPALAEVHGSAICRPGHAAVIEKYKVETLRHAANVIFNKLNEAHFCGSNSEQGREALFDAQVLADVIVQSENAESSISRRYWPNTGGEPRSGQQTGEPRA